MDSNISSARIKTKVFLAISVSKTSRGMECLCLGSCLSERHVTGPCVPAAILGMHTLMSNQQYYQALDSSSIVNKEGLNSEYRPAPCPTARASRK